jgi:hypothetical protein
MSIVSSSFSTDTHSQVTGGRWTVEVHTDHLGGKHIVGPYLWDGLTDRAAAASVRAEELSRQLADIEVVRLLS